MASAEKPDRRVGLVTGGGRGTGAKIALYLARANYQKGATLVGDPKAAKRDYDPFDVAVGHQREDAAPKAARVVKAIEESGRRAIALRGDLVIPDQRIAVVRGLGEWAGKAVGLVVYNHAAGMGEDVPPDYGDQVNYEATLALLDELVPELDENATFVTVGSSWSELYPDLAPPTTEGPMAEYDNRISRTKKKAADTLEVEIPRVLPNARQLRFGIGIIEDTAMGRSIRANYPEFFEAHRDLENVVQTDEVALRIAEAVNDPSLPHGAKIWVGAEPGILLEKFPRKIMPEEEGV